MYFDSFSALIEMGGHGPYVWSAYAIATVVLVSLVVVPLRRSQRFLTEQRMQLRREQRQSSV